MWAGGRSVPRGASGLRAGEGDLDPAVLLAAGFRRVVGDGVLLAVAADLVGDAGVVEGLGQDVVYGVGPAFGEYVAVGGGAEVVGEAEDADSCGVLGPDLVGDASDADFASAPSFELSLPNSTSAWSASVTLVLVSSRRSSPLCSSTTDLMSSTFACASVAPSGSFRSGSLGSTSTGAEAEGSVPGGRQLRRTGSRQRLRPSVRTS